MALDKAFVGAALAAKDKAYAPYSNHPVGAAVRTADGSIYSGCNVENAAFPLGQCAEGGAISQMVLEGHKKITEVVVVGPGKHACTPCGGCRQKIREFGDEKTVIYVCDNEGELILQTTLGDLLPHSFGPDNVKEQQ